MNVEFAARTAIAMAVEVVELEIVVVVVMVTRAVVVGVAFLNGGCSLIDLSKGCDQRIQSFRVFKKK